MTEEYKHLAFLASTLKGLAPGSQENELEKVRAYFERKAKAATPKKKAKPAKPPVTKPEAV